MNENEQKPTAVVDSTRLVDANDVQWIVNDLGELGVEIHGKCFFLYKGRSLEYSEDPTHDDGSPMLYRRVGKREFGETQWPAKWLEAGRCEDRYDVELAYHPALSDGPPNNPVYHWRPIPQASTTQLSQRGENHE